MDKLGVDVGGVIIDQDNDGTDSSFFSQNFLNATASPYMFEILAKLVNERFKGQVFIVSKCGERMEEKTMAWFEYHNFFERVGLPSRHVWFCRTRDGKAPICKALGITHFIDNRLEVLRYLDTVPNQFLFQGNKSEIRRHKQHLAKVHEVSDWNEFGKLLL